LDQKPISDLGFDPILSHPTFEEFKELIGKKKGTVKGVIMDQAFSAGVGNVSDHNVFSKLMLMISGWPMSETQRI
jgi:formamidopyrimidine-DNA glycosylase